MSVTDELLQNAERYASSFDTFKDDDVKAQIEADTGIRPPFALEAFAELNADVRQSIARIRSSPFIPRKDSVRGFVYDVETGSLREVS